MSDFKKEDIRLWAVMFSNRCRFTLPIYEPDSVEYGFKEGFRVALEKMQANGITTCKKQLTIPVASESLCPKCKLDTLTSDGNEIYCTNCGKVLSGQIER